MNIASLVSNSVAMIGLVILLSLSIALLSLARIRGIQRDSAVIFGIMFLLLIVLIAISV